MAQTLIVSILYQYLRNFKTDINAHIDGVEKRLNERMNQFDKRMDNLESKIISIEERMFWMATGKRLEDAILEERLKVLRPILNISKSN